MEPLLFHAVKLGRTEIIRTLLLRGVNVDAKNSDGNTPLHVSLKKKNKEIVKLLIDFGADVNIENNESDTALNLAVDFTNENTKSTMMKMVIKAGADVNGKKYGTMTALQWAITTGDVELVQLLIDRGADVHTTDESYSNWTALHYAAYYVSSEDPAMFEILLSAGADIHARNVLGETPLHTLSKYEPESPSLSLLKIAEVFLKYKADFNLRDCYGCTPLDCAVQLPHYEAVKALVLVGGANVDIKFTPHDVDWDPNGETVLHHACYIKSLPVVKILLKNGANINALDEDNISPLQRVIDRVNITVNRYEDEKYHAEEMRLLKYLLKWSPDVNTVTIDSENILTSRVKAYKLPDILWKTLIQYIAKLWTIGKPIHTSLLKTISSNPEYEIYFERCKDELQVAKNTRLHSDSWVTFLNILINEKSKLVQYAGNRDFKKDLTAERRFIGKFPIYGTQIRERFLKAMETRRILEHSMDTLSRHLPITLDPSHFIIIKILSFCKIKDLRKLSQ